MLDPCRLCMPEGIPIAALGPVVFSMGTIVKLPLDIQQGILQAPCLHAGWGHGEGRLPQGFTASAVLVRVNIKNPIEVGHEVDVPLLQHCSEAVIFIVPLYCCIAVRPKKEFAARVDVTLVTAVHTSISCVIIMSNSFVGFNVAKHNIERW